MPNRKVQPHDFWLQTCGLDTHHRGPGNARVDTPWNSFTKDAQKLVCTLWSDCIVPIQDNDAGRLRHFVLMGGRSEQWHGVGKFHGTQAEANLDRAISDNLLIYGYVADPISGALKNGIRAVKHFNLDQVHLLKPWIGVSRAALEKRLKINEHFINFGITDLGDPNLPPKLFEVLDTDSHAPDSSMEEQESFIQVERDHAEPFEGNLTDEEYSWKALPILIGHVAQQVDGHLIPITYHRLAEILGRRDKHGNPYPRGLGHVLGKVTALIDSIAEKLPAIPPFLTTIVVQSNGTTKGLPDTGVKGKWPGYDLLSKADKQTKIDGEYQKILNYGSYWNEVLRLLGIAPIEPPVQPEIPSPHRGWGGRESDEHIALKKFVLEHPELFGADSDYTAEDEYSLRSLDEVDVMFKSEHRWVGVEVKSKVSDNQPSDYQRGIYQVIKYKAILEAQAKVDCPENPPKVFVYLALEGTLPAKYREEAKTLGIKFHENVGDTESPLFRVVYQNTEATSPIPSSIQS